MARTPTFPPRITTVRGRARCFANGRYHYLGEPGSPEAHAAYAALVATLSGGTAPPPSQPVTAAALTVADVVAAFLLHAERRYDPAGREPQQYAATVRPLLQLHGDTAASAFGPKALRQVQTAITAPPYSWSRGVTNRRLVRIKTLWRWAESEELVPAGSYHALATVRGLAVGARGVRETPGHLPTPWEDLELVRSHCPGLVGTMLAVQWWAGMRSCEVRLMRVSEIDCDGPVVDGVAVWLYRPARHKNTHRGQTRVIPLGPEAQRLLVGLEPGPSGLLFPARRGVSQADSGKPYSSCTYARAVARACERAGVKLTPYGGRHSAANRAKAAGGLDGARAFLGHASLTTTNGYGDQIDATQAAALAARLG